MTRRSFCLAAVGSLWLAGLGQRTALAAAPLAPFNTEPSTTQPMPAAETARQIKTPPGFRCTVFASEPDVQQPIGMATDPRGRLWVAENYTYSEQRVGYHPQLRDRIVILEDTNHDGRADRRKVFWDDAERLTSVEVGLGGVWAICLPNLVFIPDANGDDIPDGPPKVLLDGFEFQKARHTVANGLRWGPDGWLYGRQGILGTSRLGPPGTPDAARISMNVGIWRFHPTRHVFEVVAQGTTNPWGMDWDAHGEALFINTVIGHLWQLIPGAHYRRMFGDDSDPHVYELLEQSADHVHWATGEAWTDVRKGATDATLAAGGGHAHTGLLIYQGGQWPPAWNGKLLTINLHGRRLNVERLDQRGSAVVAHHDQDAFLFPDPWFRGIDLLAAPDGGVFVSDWSDTGECHDQEGIHRTSGRIYHLGFGAPGAALAASPDLATLPAPELARLQTSPNDWLARQARRVLALRKAQGQRPGDVEDGREALRQLARKHTNEVVRLRALWALHVSGGLEPELLRAKLSGTEFERVWAIRLLEDQRHDSAAPSAAFAALVRNSFLRLAASDPSPRVRLALASLLQQLPLSQRPALGQALLAHAEDAGDPNLPLLIWYGLEPLATNEANFVDWIAAARLPRVQRLAARRLAEEIDAAPQRVDALLRATASAGSLSARQAVLDGLADGLAGRRRVPRPANWKTTEAAFANGADETLLNRLRDLSALFGDGRALDQIRAVALNPSADLPRRNAALLALIEARAPDLRAVCEKTLPVRDLSATSAKGLSFSDDPAVAQRLIAEWPHLYGHERPPVLNVLLSRSAWVRQVLNAIADGRMRRTDLGVPQARQIGAFNDPALRRQLAQVWGVMHDADETVHAETLRRWKDRLAPEKLARARPGEGQKVFTAVCGACHRLHGAGGTLGPDLTGSGRQNLDYLLENVLFPNAVVPAEFRQSTLALKDGRVLTGIVRRSAGQSVAFEMVGASFILDRAEIEREETSALSLMPEGLLDALPEGQAVDLIAFLMSPFPPSEGAR